MHVRPATHRDVDELLAMGARMHAEGAYSFLPFDREKVRLLMISYIDNPETQCGLVAEEGDALVGMFAGYLTDYFFCDEKIACDMILFVERERRGGTAAVKLIRAFREWARERGASEICLGVSTKIDTERTGKFYERMGLTNVGALYKQRLA
ncbi:MAG: GNAT family N-acetyltransferase [Pyrinomonadaceae bacterium]